MCEFSDLTDEPVILTQSVLDNVTDILETIRKQDCPSHEATLTTFNENAPVVAFYAHYHPHEGLQPE